MHREHPIASQFVGQAKRLSADMAQAFQPALGEIFACMHLVHLRAFVVSELRIGSNCKLPCHPDGSGSADLRKRFTDILKIRESPRLF